MSSPNSPSLSKRVLEEAWICLLGFYGRAFEAQYGNIDGEQFALWFAGLASNGVTDEMVAAAARAVPTEHARKTSHPPNFADFLKLCMDPQLCDVASEDQAFAEANSAARNWDRHQWSSAAVYHATVAVGVWSLRQFPEKVTRPRFVEAYRKFVERERAGEVLDPPPQLTVDTAREPPRPVDQEYVRERRQRLRDLSNAILELPTDLQRTATEVLKTGVFVSREVLLPSSVTVSDRARALLLEFCCNIKEEIPNRESSAAAEEPLFSAPTL